LHILNRKGVEETSEEGKRIKDRKKMGYKKKCQRILKERRGRLTEAGFTWFKQ